MKKNMKTKEPPKILELKISLLHTSPLVWRKFLVHDFIELEELNLLIQICMGWENCHLHDFVINKKTYSDSETAIECIGTLSNEGVKLCDVLGDSKKFIYTYDFGDGWKHEVKISKVLEYDPDKNYPVCIGGENACPPEDCGGIYGFEELKSILAGKNTARKKELLAWLGGFYDPTTFDPNIINRYFLWNDQ